MEVGLEVWWRRRGRWVVVVVRLLLKKKGEVGGEGEEIEAVVVGLVGLVVGLGLMVGWS